MPQVVSAVFIKYMILLRYGSTFTPPLLEPVSLRLPLGSEFTVATVLTSVATHRYMEPAIFKEDSLLLLLLTVLEDCFVSVTVLVTVSMSGKNSARVVTNTLLHLELVALAVSEPVSARAAVVLVPKYLVNISKHMIADCVKLLVFFTPAWTGAWAVPVIPATPSAMRFFNCLYRSNSNVFSASRTTNFFFIFAPFSSTFMT